MTEMSSSPIQQRTVARQTTEPANPLDGFLWINPEGGQNGNNAERYLWNGTAWDLLDSTGPDTPLHAAAGASWTDTANGTVKNHRGGVWENVGVTDYNNLSNTPIATGLTEVSGGYLNNASEFHRLNFSSNGQTLTETENFEDAEFMDGVKALYEEGSGNDGYTVNSLEVKDDGGTWTTIDTGGFSLAAGGSVTKEYTFSDRYVTDYRFSATEDGGSAGYGDADITVTPHVVSVASHDHSISGQ